MAFQCNFYFRQRNVGSVVTQSHDNDDSDVDEDEPNNEVFGVATVIKLATLNAAKAIRKPELGSLEAGAVGDASILELRAGEFEYLDVIGEQVVGRERLLGSGVVIGGKWWHPA